MGAHMAFKVTRFRNFMPPAHVHVCCPCCSSRCNKQQVPIAAGTTIDSPTTPTLICGLRGSSAGACCCRCGIPGHNKVTNTSALTLSRLALIRGSLAGTSSILLKQHTFKHSSSQNSTATHLDLRVLMALAQVHVAVDAVHSSHAPLQHIGPLCFGLATTSNAAARAGHDLQGHRKLVKLGQTYTN